MKAKEIILDNNLLSNELFTYKNEGYEKNFFLNKLIDLENNEISYYGYKYQIS